ncbi:penicillin-binding protein [Candidatus Frankia alpina]|uniref:PASTA domain-containing protein n=1 Tax=Candidatus Frankia alpina TaxID=2699483 RepID=A0A4S5ETL9_9ACTN|nr:penicillin-binding protein [Candidatus Frankia alpina]THJ75831.1 PASTA domain-containing protein [Candidatus Frankia alpina]
MTTPPGHPVPPGQPPPRRRPAPAGSASAGSARGREVGDLYRPRPSVVASRGSNGRGGTGGRSGTGGRRTRRMASRLAGLGLLSVVAGVLVGMLALPVVGAVGLTVKDSADDFMDLPPNLTVPPLAQASRILDARGNQIAVLSGEQNREIVPLSRVPQVMRRAVVDIEDSRFYEHDGLDYKGLIRAYLTNRENGEVTQGGSTLTQQYVKNVLLMSATTPAEKKAATEQTVRRKLREARYALYLEAHLSKDEILERYLNIAYFGDGAYGIEVAAKHYFNVGVERLTLPQAATLAGLVKNPTAFNPVLHPQTARERRNVVLDRMLELHHLSQADFRRAHDSELVLDRPARSADPCADSGAPFFCALVRQQLLKDRTFAPTEEDARRLLFEGGLTIRTTLDPVAEQAAQSAATEVIPIGNRVAASVAMMQPGTGQVLAVAINREYGATDDGQPASLPTDFVHTKEIYPVDEDSFSPGSTFKVFTLISALESGLPLSTTLHAPVCYHSNVFPNPDPQNKNCYGNADPSEDGFYSLTTATWGSVNTYYIQLAEKLGVLKTAEVARRMGVSSCRIRPQNNDDPECKGIDGISRVDGSSILGSNEISTMDLATAYSTLAARGRRCDPRTVLAITQRVGGADRPLPFNAGAPCEQVLDPKIADTVSAVLEGVIKHGTASGNGQIGRPAAGKTGTAEGFSTASFAGYIPQLAAAVTLADPRGPTSHPLTNVLGRNVFGGGYPAQVWSRTMTRTINGLGLPVEPLPAPDDTQPQVPVKVLPNVVGQPQQVAEQILVQLGFHVTSQPVPAPVAPGIVVYMSPGPGGPVSINTEIRLAVSGGLTGAPVLPGGSPPAGLGQPVPPAAGTGLPGTFGANPREQLSSPASSGNDPLAWPGRPRGNRTQRRGARVAPAGVAL